MLQLWPLVAADIGPLANQYLLQMSSDAMWRMQNCFLWKIWNFNSSCESWQRELQENSSTGRKLSATSVRDITFKVTLVSCAKQNIFLCYTTSSSYVLRLQYTNRILQEALWDMLVGQSALLTCKHFTGTITVIPLSFQVVGDDSHTVLNYLPLHPRTTHLPLKQQSGASSFLSDVSESFTPSRLLPLLSSPLPYLQPAQSPSQSQRSKSEVITPELFSHTNFSNNSVGTGCSSPLVLCTLYHDSPEILWQSLCSTPLKYFV